MKFNERIKWESILKLKTGYVGFIFEETHVGVMFDFIEILFISWFIGIFVLIISEKLDKSLAALLGAIGIIAFGVTFDVFRYSDTFAFLDLGVIGILIGTFMITEVAEEVGLFEFTAIKFLKISGGEPKRLFLYFSVLIISLSSILSNLVATVLVSSLTIVACKNLGLDPKPYIFGEAIFANLGGLLTLISSVPNILVSLAAGIGFLEYLAVSIPLAIIVGTTSYFLLIRVLRVKDTESELLKEEMRKKVEAFDEWSVVKDRKAFRNLIIVISLVLVLFVISDVLKFGLEFIAISGAVASIMFTNVNLENILSNVDWSIIFFVGPLLVLVEGFSQLGLIKQISSFIVDTSSGNYLVLGILFIWLVGILSSLIVDIPLTAALIPIIEEASVLLQREVSLLWWALIFGIGLGANYTPFGSSSTIIALSILRKEQDVAFSDFTKVGLIVCTVQLIIGTLYLVFNEIVFNSLGGI
ncbi:MAG: SLC13 family permease [Candidatus Kariarchaeaceae archaeon]|jgi:Na+/H+ antiporter NhaD/arsenite permease-like protein